MESDLPLSPQVVKIRNDGRRGPRWPARRWRSASRSGRTNGRRPPWPRSREVEQKQQQMATKLWGQAVLRLPEEGRAAFGPLGPRLAASWRGFEPGTFPEPSSRLLSVLAAPVLRPSRPRRTRKLPAVTHLRPEIQFFNLKAENDFKTDLLNEINQR